MIQRVIYQSRTLSNILFFIEHTFLKRHCVTGVFVVASGLGAAAFTSQVTGNFEQSLTALVPPWVCQNGIKMGNWIKSSAINRKKMIDNVFD